MKYTIRHRYESFIPRWGWSILHWVVYAPSGSEVASFEKYENAKNCALVLATLGTKIAPV